MNAVMNLCRICLSNHDNMQTLFEENEASCIEICQKIEDISGVVLNYNEEFPKKICKECLKSLETSCRFKNLCLTSDRNLIELLEMKFEPAEYTNSEREELFVETVDGIKYKMIEKAHPEKKRRKTIIKTKTNTKRNSNESLKKVDDADDSEDKKQHTQRNDSLNTIMCDICGNLFQTRHLLSLHLRRHKAEKPYDCEICGKKFVCPSEMVRHMRIHTGEKPFACKFCGRKFTDPSSIIRHERVHTNTRPYKCRTCGKSFTYSNVLSNHMLTHTGEKAFACVPCNKTFSRKHQLDQHIGTQTHQLNARIRT